MFSNLFHMELIRYTKNKSALASVILTLFLYIFSFLFFKLELLIMQGSDSLYEEEYVVLQNFALQALTSMFAFFMGISVILTTTSFYKNRIYYNVNGVISSRIKLFFADLTVLFVIAASGTAVVVLYSFLVGRHLNGHWIFLRSNTMLIFAILFVFTRIFFCILGGFALSHLFRRAALAISVALAFQSVQGVLFFATTVYIRSQLGDDMSSNPFAAAIGSLEAPTMALLNVACGADSPLMPGTTLAITSVPFAIIFIVAAISAGRRIEV